jgi:hypothetical protein
MLHEMGRLTIRDTWTECRLKAKATRTATIEKPVCPAVLVVAVVMAFFSHVGN